MRTQPAHQISHMPLPQGKVLTSSKSRFIKFCGKPKYQRHRGIWQASRRPRPTGVHKSAVDEITIECLLSEYRNRRIIQLVDLCTA